MDIINNCGDNRAFGKGTMKLKKNTFYQYCVGDVVKNDYDYYKTVIGVINQNCYIMSNGRESTHCSSTFSVKELEDLGYEPYIEEEEEDNWREQLVKIVKEHSDEITMRYNIDGKITDARPMNIDGEDI